MPSPQRKHGEPSLSQRRRLAISITSLRQLVKSKGTPQYVHTWVAIYPHMSSSQYSQSLHQIQELPSHEENAERVLNIFFILFCFWFRWFRVDFYDYKSNNPAQPRGRAGLLVSYSSIMLCRNWAAVIMGRVAYSSNPLRSFVTITSQPPATAHWYCIISSKSRTGP